jgi:catechol 2,3-dioxygenase-like lactoylglutathione lyase family enzyme
VIDRFDRLYITAADFEKSLAFYRDTLGWDVTRECGGSGGEPRVAMLSSGGLKVVISEKAAAGVPAAKDTIGDGRAIVHLDIHDLKARFGSVPAGDHVVRKPEGTHWGTRWFVVRDPDGNLIAFEELHPRVG